MTEDPLNSPAPPDWRQAVQQVMREATEREILNRYGSLDVSFNYRWEHVKVVVTLARKLTELVGADAEVVEALDRAIAAGVERSARALGLVVPFAQRTQGRIAPHAHRIDLAVGAAREEHIRVAATDLVRR